MFNESQKQQKYFSVSEARAKIQKWCAYQERSHSETKRKLISYGLNDNEVDQLIAELIVEGFLNEERFAIAFAGGKFRILGWGKEKIKNALKQRNISDACIRRALQSLQDENYISRLRNVLEKKVSSLKETDTYRRSAKLYQFGISRGYEREIVMQIIREIGEEGIL
jgi:regulatory protein